MDYFVKRGEQQFGPYTLAALQQYVKQGNISPQDLARSEGMTDWVPVSTVLGNVPVTAPSAFGAAARAAEPAAPPPKLHWGLLLVLSIVTIGIFAVIWLFVQAVWIRKVQPNSKALFYLIGYIAATFGSAALEGKPLAAMLSLGGLVLFLVAVFSMRSEIQDEFAKINPAGRAVSGVMTFFFNTIYFQYVLNEFRETVENNAIAAGATV